MQRLHEDLLKIAEGLLSEHSNVWDIGGNLGTFGLAAAKKASLGTVVCAEADIWLASILRKSVAANGFENLVVLPSAISNRVGIERFLIAARGRASNALEKAGGHSQMGGVRAYHHTPTLTLDTLLGEFGPPDFIKIDVEGGEQAVLMGAKQVIEDARPVFYCEVSDRHSDYCLSLFHGADYSAYARDGSVINDKCANNVFFIPVENRAAPEVICSLNLPV